MSEYEEILGIKIPNNTNIKAVTNSSKKVLKDSIFFGLKGNGNWDVPVPLSSSSTLLERLYLSFWESKLIIPFIQ